MLEGKLSLNYVCKLLRMTRKHCILFVQDYYILGLECYVMYSNKLAYVSQV